MVRQRVLPDQEREFHVRQPLEQPRAPRGNAFRPWRQVARGAGAGKAEPHRQDGHAALVVELGSCDSHPVAQPLAARVVEGNASFVDTPARRLARNEDARVRMQLQHRSYAMGQPFRADGAGADLREEGFERAHDRKLIERERLQRLAPALSKFVAPHDGVRGAGGR